MGKPEKKTIISPQERLSRLDRGRRIARRHGMHAQQGDLPISGIHHIAQPYWFGEGMQSGHERGRIRIWAARELERAIDEIGEDKIAPSLPNRSRAPAVSSFRPRPIGPKSAGSSNERDILFISDEVICGFGRTGEWFGADTTAQSRT
jgi:putrescine aminotransferase